LVVTWIGLSAAAQRPAEQLRANNCTDKINEIDLSED